MKNRKLWFTISIIVFITASILLITGSSLMTLSLSQEANIPLGTFITWLGMISLPLSLYFGIGRLREPVSTTYKYLSYFLKGLIGLGVLWVPICFLLAGNIAFNFTEKAEFQGGQTAMRIFWYYSYALVCAPLLLWVTHGILGLFRRN